ncbi:MAG: polysaccharide biosynthesis tyrosine autokinase [Pseudomonadota bacterium]
MNQVFTLEQMNQVSGAKPEASAPIDIKSLIETAKRRIALISAGFALVFLAVCFITFTQTPVYTAKATVIVDTNQANVIDLGNVLGGLAGNTAAIDTEVEVMGSKALLEKVAIQENLAEDPEFNPFLETEDNEGGITSSVRDQVYSIFGLEREETDPFEDATAEERAAEIQQVVVRNLQSKTKVSRIGTTYLLVAEVNSTSPETAANIANAIADQYRIEQLDAKLEATKRANEWLSVKVEDLRNEVTDKERLIEQFRSASGLLSAQGTTLTEQNIATLQQQKLQLRQELARTRARYDSMQRQINTSGSVDALGEVLNSQVISDLRSQQAIVLRKLADLEANLLPRHPDVISARGEAADIQARIDAEIQRIVSSLGSEVKVAQDQIAAIDRSIAASRNELESNNKSLVTLRELERDAAASRELLNDFISRFKETREQDDLIQADARILSRASVPKNPSSPQKLLNLILGVFLGGIVGGMIAILSDALDNKISSADDVERKLGVNVAGIVPRIQPNSMLGRSRLSPADDLVKYPLSAYAESVRYLRAAIAFSDIDQKTRTVAITSALPDEGKTSLSLSLGRMSAMSGTKTLLIDGDFRRGQATEALGLVPDKGFVEYLLGQAELSEVIIRDPKTDLDMLVLSRTGHTPHDVFGTKKFDELLEQFKSEYDLVLIDTGPLLLMAEARVIAGKVDKTLLVLRWRQTTRSAARQAIKLLHNFNAQLLGVTLNRVDLRKRRQHSDPSIHNKAYQKYYNVKDNKRFTFNSKARKMTAAPVKTAENSVTPSADNADRPLRAVPVRAATGSD